MNKKALTMCIVAITVLFLNLCFLFLNSSDDLSDFIPLMTTAYDRHKITLYDLLVILAILFFRRVYIYYRIRPVTELKEFANLFIQPQIINIVLIIGSAIFAYFWLWPTFYGIFKNPLRLIQVASDPIRRTVIIILPAVWLLVIGLINSSKGYHTPAQIQAQSFLPPPGP